MYFLFHKMNWFTDLPRKWIPSGVGMSILSSACFGSQLRTWTLALSGGIGVPWKRLLPGIASALGTSSVLPCISRGMCSSQGVGDMMVSTACPFWSPDAGGATKNIGGIPRSGFPTILSWSISLNFSIKTSSPVSRMCCL